MLTAMSQPGLSIKPNRPAGNSPGSRARLNIRRTTQLLLLSMSEAV